MTHLELKRQLTLVNVKRCLRRVEGVILGVDRLELALGHVAQKKAAPGMIGRLIAAMRGGF